MEDEHCDTGVVPCRLYRAHLHALLCEAWLLATPQELVA